MRRNLVTMILGCATGMFLIPRPTHAGDFLAGYGLGMLSILFVGATLAVMRDE